MMLSGVMENPLSVVLKDAPRAVDVLERLLTAESESVALSAANSLIDRSFGKARERVEVAAEITVKRPW
jgi:hypothetical protein